MFFVKYKKRGGNRRQFLIAYATPPFIEVNVITLTKLTKLFLPDFVKHGDGRILNV